jgi:hypothetical protein
MNALKFIAIVLTLALLGSLTSPGIAHPISSQIKAAEGSFPWVLQLFESVNFSSISTSFGGVRQVPMLSYILPDGHTHRVATKWFTPLNQCGPGNAWSCHDFDLDIMGGYESGTMSDMAVQPITDETEYRVGWVFLNESGQIRHFYRLFGSSGNQIGVFNETLYNLPDDHTIIGHPSLAYDSDGKPRVALLLRYSDIQFPADKLLYISYSGSSNTSCDTSSMWQCDLIGSATGMWSYHGSPVLALNASDQPRIVYTASYISGDFLQYAYPQANPDYSPNCGPSDNTWRCITITGDNYEITGLDMDMGSTNPQVAYTIAVTDLITETHLQYAKRVGTLGGDCGTDKVWFLTGVVETETWDCSTITPTDDNGFSQDVTIQVDADNQPLIAYRENDTGGYWDLRLFHGDPETDHTDILLANGGPGDSNQGRALDLALNNVGLGLLAYSEDVLTETNLRIAFQEARIFLPSILR